MRKLAMAFVAAGIMMSAGAVQAQNNKVVSAWKYLGDYKKSRDAGSLSKAKEAIDLATEHESTKAEAKTWLYRAQVYQTYFEHNLKENTNKVEEQDPNKKMLMGYQSTSTELLGEAYEALKKVREYDDKKTYEKEALQRLNISARHYENKGIAHYNSQGFKDALPMFEMAVDVNAYLGKVDSSNMNNAAIVAERSGNIDKARTLYDKLLEIDFGGAATYNSYYNVLLNNNDKDGAMAVVKKGLEKYPNDVNLIKADINFALEGGDQTKAIENLKKAIAKEPTNSLLYLVLGNVYDNLANPKDTAGEDLPKPEKYEEYLANAETNYKKAIEVKPDYFDALYNLGVMYNNKGVAIAKKADSIMDQAKYAKENAKANEEFARAIPLLEKAHELMPDDFSTKSALKMLYARTGQPEKAKAMGEKMK